MSLLDQISAALQQLNQIISWRDIIDILIVSYIFYRLILVIRGTRAEQMIKAMVLLVVATVVSGLPQVELTTLHWLLRQLLPVGLIAIAIIFQPELRRALEQLGRGKFFQRSYWDWTPQEFDQMLEELGKAITVFVKKRIGALIVIERETGLKEWAQTGITVDGEVSAELLINIFFPNSPLHDGAVIIRGNKIVAAGCFLPLTDDPYLSKDLGTRHRAGLGASEQSDAVAIIVSEETGIISIAQNGILTRYLDEKKLRDIINDLCGPSKSEGSFWPWRNVK